jgi:hypothetical protein
VTFDDVLEQALEMLRRRGRVSYRALKVQFQLDDDLLALLRDEIVEVHQLVVYLMPADNSIGLKTRYNAPISTRFGGGKAMVPPLFFYQLALFVLVWLFVILHVTWSKPGLTTPPVPAQPKRKRSRAPKPFAGLTHKPHCAWCALETVETTPAPPVRPDPIPPTNRHPRTVDTSHHFCPHAGCRYRGWLGLGNLRANGHPSGGPWRQFQCTACEGYFLEHYGTIFHGKQVAVELIVRVLAPLGGGFGYSRHRTGL